MTSRIRTITVDCADALTVARFWGQALGWHVFTDHDPEVLVVPSFPHLGPEPSLLFVPVPEKRITKNRLHLDLQPTDRSRDEEIDRLLRLGASIVEDHRLAGGGGWVWLADPEGNDFCVELSVADRAATETAREFRIST